MLFYTPPPPSYTVMANKENDFRIQVHKICANKEFFFFIHFMFKINGICKDLGLGGGSGGFGGL